MWRSDQLSFVSSSPWPHFGSIVLHNGIYWVPTLLCIQYLFPLLFIITGYCHLLTHLTEQHMHLPATNNSSSFINQKIYPHKAQSITNFIHISCCFYQICLNLFEKIEKTLIWNLKISVELSLLVTNFKFLIVSLNVF